MFPKVSQSTSPSLSAEVEGFGVEVHVNFKRWQRNTCSQQLLTRHHHRALSQYALGGGKKGHMAVTLLLQLRLLGRGHALNCTSENLSDSRELRKDIVWGLQMKKKAWFTPSQSYDVIKWHG